ncbi:hypothetical protein SDC9_170850 [bioreactor metagenome]|uniref:Uncharacterized protein n=1 Tax=bioreactor metagenome TaxID=1076179 RepID=A0A645GBV0_9ZZZZ
MQVQFHPFFVFRRTIFPFRMSNFVHVSAVHNQIPHESVFLDTPAHAHPDSFFDKLKVLFIRFIRRKQFYRKGRGIIRHFKYEQFPPGPQFADFTVENIAFNDHRTLFFGD